MKKTLASLFVMGMFAVVGCSGDDKDSGGGTGTPEEACKNIMGEMCAKFFGCFSKEELSAVAELVGANEADCRTKFVQAQCGSQMVKCDSGETYSSSKAKECLDQFKAFSCTEFGQGNVPAACDTVCQ